jgi:hypothetical protein
VNVSCPQHPGRAIRPERIQGGLLYVCGRHYAMAALYPKGDRPSQQVADRLNNDARIVGPGVVTGIVVR